jgi:putative phosphoribosyl transferase
LSYQIEYDQYSFKGHNGNLHMTILGDIDVTSREYAAHLLSEKLLAYKNTDAHILAIPNGGVPIGFFLANRLNLDFNVIPCRSIQLHGDMLMALGAICVDDICLREDLELIPQSFVCGQLQVIRKKVENEFNLYNTIKPATSLKGVTVILVDDGLLDSHKIIACLHSIQKQKPARIVVAIPFITDQAYIIAKEVDELVFLYKDSRVQRVRERLYVLPKVTQEAVKVLLSNSIKPETVAVNEKI